MGEELHVALSRLLGERKEASAYLSEYDQRIPFARDWKRRIADIDRIINGDWELTLGGGDQTVEEPKVPNIPKIASLIRAASAASVLPSLRADYGLDESKAAKAHKREHVGFNYLTLWNYDLEAIRYFMDRSVTGACFRVVLPNYETGYPTCYRIDPRHAYPDRPYDPNRPYTSFVVSYQDVWSSLKKSYGDEMSYLRESARMKGTELVQVIEYYDGSEWLKVACYKQGAKQYGVQLGASMKNLTGKCPVVASATPHPDSQFHGEYDQLGGILRHQNRGMALLLDYLAEMIGAPYRIDPGSQFDGKEIGPGSVIPARAGEVERLQPGSAHPEVFKIMADLGQFARVAANFPEGLTGQVQQSIISAAGVNSLMASYFTSIALDQRLEAAALKRTIALAYEIDENYHDERKDLTGVANGKTFEGSYKPGVDIKGAYRVRVVYGAGEGSDAFSKEIRIVQQRGAGLISQQTAMENINTIENVEKEIRQIEQEKIREAVFAFIGAAAQQGDMKPLAVYKQLLDEARKKGEDVDMLEVMAALGVVPAQGQQAGDAFTQAASTARGGVPEQATTVPGVANPATSVQTLAGVRGDEALPPLSTVRLVS